MRAFALIVFSLAAGLLQAGFACELHAAERPNVVIILSDDQAWTDYGFMGHKTIQTPHLDRLASESLVYTRGYVPTSLCRPSLMSLVTGRYPHEHGITGNDPPKGTPREALLKFVRDTPTLPRLLSDAGYRTFQSGKWWEGSFRDGGFTHGMSHGDPTRGGRHGDVGLKIGREGLEPVFQFITESKDQPFFVWYAPMLPHQPHNPPQRLLAKYRDKVDSLHVAKYFAMCEWWDETCGELLKFLDDHQLSENTLVIYTCDNGWIQDPAKPTYDRRSKQAPYDAGVRTPIMFRWPAKLEPQRVEHAPVSTVNIAYSAASACGLDAKAAKAMQKLDLLAPEALLKDPSQAPDVFGENFEHDIAEIDSPGASLRYRWMIRGQHKLIVSAQGDVELFDLQDDPQERTNLAGNSADLVKTLRTALDVWWDGKPSASR